MALANYADLQASIASWMHRNDLTSVIPDFITLAEARIARDLRLRKQVVNTTLTTVALTQYVTLPSDFLEIENITVSSSPPVSLHVVTPEIMDETYPEGYVTGKPAVYCILADKIQFGPTPDSAYSISLDYYQRFNLGSTSTNWLMTNHPNIYLFAALAEASSYTKNDKDEANYLGRYQSEMEQLQYVDDDALRTGSAMRVRPM